MDVVVVGYDGTETAAIAVGEGAKIAKSMGATFHLVHVIDDDGFRQGMISGVEQLRRESSAAAMNEEILESDREDIALTLDGLTVVNDVLSGPIALCLADYAHSVQADLIVLGNRRVKGLARVLGSVTIDVLRQAPCSVYVANTTS